MMSSVLGSGWGQSGCRQSVLLGPLVWAGECSQAPYIYPWAFYFEAPTTSSSSKVYCVYTGSWQELTMAYVLVPPQTLQYSQWVDEVRLFQQVGTRCLQARRKSWESRHDLGVRVWFVSYAKESSHQSTSSPDLIPINEESPSWVGLTGMVVRCGFHVTQLHIVHITASSTGTDRGSDNCLCIVHHPSCLMAFFKLLREWQ